MTRLRVALVQLDADGDVTANIERAASLAHEAAETGSRLIALPEYLQYRGTDDGYRASAREIPGPHTEPFSDIARRHHAWILLGSLAEASGDPKRPYNTSVLLDPSGAVAATYRKVHLFDVSIDRGPVDRESERAMPGEEPVVADMAGVRLGLGQQDIEALLHGQVEKPHPGHASEIQQGDVVVTDVAPQLAHPDELDVERQDTATRQVGTADLFVLDGLAPAVMTIRVQHDRDCAGQRSRFIE